jgi:hypothetical protein
MGQHRFLRPNGGRLQRFVLAFLIMGLLIGPAWESASGATSERIPEPTSEASLEGQESSVPGGLGLVPSSPDKLSLVRMPAGLEEGAVEELPVAVDLTGSSLLLQGQPSGQGIPPVGNQLWTDTCTGWATSYYYKTYQEWLEHQWPLTSGSLPNYEHIFSPSFVYNQVAYYAPDQECDDGAQISDAMWLITTQGDLPYSQFPWDPSDCSIQPTTPQRTAAREYDGTDFGAFFITLGGGPPIGPLQNHDLTPLKQWLADNDPFVLGFPVYLEFDNYECGQVVGPPANPTTYRDPHAVAVVGYNDGWAGVGGFRIVNSWGPEWGCYGYAWLSYEFVQKYAWEAWWMTSNRPPWIESHVPDRYSPTIGGTIMMDLTPYENDREDSGTALKWYVEGADKCTVLGQGSANDVLLFQPNPGATGYDEITLILRDSEGAEDTQQLTLGWFDLDIETYLPLVLRY